MPIPLPKGKNFSIEHKLMPSDYCMPSLEIAVDHYNLSYLVSGYRRSITPLQTTSYHKGDVAFGAPFVYHRTISDGEEPYECYLIKFSFEFIEPFFDKVGRNIFDRLYNQVICRLAPQMQPKIENMLCDMLEEYNKSTPYKEFILQGMLFRLLTFVYENKLDVEAAKFSAPLSVEILDAVYYIENNFRKNIKLKELAANAHFSPSYFSRLFSARLDMPFTEYLDNVRIRHAKAMLVQTDKSIGDIAADLGFCNGDYFSYRFKAKTNMTPSQFRNRFVNSPQGKQPTKQS